MRRRYNVVRTLIAVLFVVSGCSTTRFYAPTTDAATREIKIRAGDEISVVTTRRERLSFEVTEVRPERFVGVTVKPQGKEHRPAGEIVEVPYNELVVLRVRRVSALGTALAVVTVGAFAAVSAVAVPPAAALAAP